MNQADVKMKMLIIFFFGIVLFSNCGPCVKYKDEIYAKEGSNSRLDSTIFNKAVKAYDEPDLKNLNYESYRVINAFTFRRDTSDIIRIEARDSGYYCINKKLFSINGAPRVVVQKTERKISENEWYNFTDKIYKIRYWTLLGESKDESGYTDGNWWIIEGRRPHAENCGKRAYHLIVRLVQKDEKITQLYAKFKDIAAKNYSKNE